MKAKTKGQLLLEDFLNKLGKSLQTREWDDLVAGWDAREKLELYLSPPRDEKGHFKSINGSYKHLTNAEKISQDLMLLHPYQRNLN